MSSLPAAENVVIKGIREEAAEADGYRVLVDRLWPRGVSRQRAALDGWAKDATPSTGLRRGLHDGTAPWPEFVADYRAELGRTPGAEAVADLRRRAMSGRVTLLVAAHDRVRCHARVLREAVLGVADPDLP